MLCVRGAGVVAKRAAVTWAHILTLHHRLMSTDGTLLYRGSAVTLLTCGLQCCKCSYSLGRRDTMHRLGRAAADGVLDCPYARKIAREVKLEVHRDAADAESVLRQ
eukprot:2552653-Pleurochrysis_carterae.AAC.1